MLLRIVVKNLLHTPYIGEIVKVHKHILRMIKGIAQLTKWKLKRTQKSRH